jgi:hypothetical protein
VNERLSASDMSSLLAEGGELGESLAEQVATAA